MPTIIYIESDGREHEVEVAVGETVMQGAVDNGIEGILAECGGACSCATCHCYIGNAWLQTAGEADGMEKDMLADVLDPQPNSRLSCQVCVSERMEGMRVTLPKSQY